MAPALFSLPGGMLVPVLALGMIVWLLSGTSWTDTRDVLIATAAGAVVFLVGRAVSARRS
jgi:hypothetical protein